MIETKPTTATAILIQHSQMDIFGYLVNKRALFTTVAMTVIVDHTTSSDDLCYLEINSILLVLLEGLKQIGLVWSSDVSTGYKLFIL